MVSTCFGQGIIQIGFEGPPPQPPGTDYLIQEYFEAGMSFRPIGIVEPGIGFGRVGAGDSRSPYNGSTSYLRASGADTLAFSFTNGAIFNLLSVDLAEYSTVDTEPALVRLVGYRQDGSFLITNIVTDGIMDGTGPLADFQTFLIEGFTNLVRVEIPTTSDLSAGWSLDNLVVQPIPEPASFALLLFGGLLLVRQANKLK